VSSSEEEEERREIINIYFLFPRCAGEIGRGILIDQPGLSNLHCVRAFAAWPLKHRGYSSVASGWQALDCWMSVERWRLMVGQKRISKFTWARVEKDGTGSRWRESAVVSDAPAECSNWTFVQRGVNCLFFALVHVRRFPEAFGPVARSTVDRVIEVR
jgi:hypothetical protein